MNSQRLTRSLPTHSADGLPVYVAASPATPFLDFARNDKRVGRIVAAVSDRRRYRSPSGPADKAVATVRSHVGSRVNSIRGILLRKRRLSDTSLIVSWCTDSMGVIQTVARGARRPKSPFAGRLDLFFEAELSIAISRKSNLHTLREVAIRNPFAGIRTNYLRTETASYFVELIEICTETEHHEPEIFNLLQRAFGYLAVNDPSAHVISHFETELARIAGVHNAKSNPAMALSNLFGKLPRSRARVLKQVSASGKTTSLK